MKDFGIGCYEEDSFVGFLEQILKLHVIRKLDVQHFKVNKLRFKQKLIFILSILFFTIIPFCNTADPSFMIYKPNNGQIFTIGNNIITWNPPEDVSHVKIELYKGFNHMKALDIWIDNTGEFIWIINSDDTYEYRLDYRIKISSSIDPDIYGWSDYFCINLYPLDINIISIIVIVILLIIVSIIYYDKKTHKVQNCISDIRKKIRNRNKDNDEEM